jgi:predicted amidohydrolase YtcJ
MRLRGERTRLIDARGRRVIPGLNDSHLHAIRGGLQYNLELRWDGVGSLARGLQMILEQAMRTPKDQWVRVMGGWSPYQFKERRFPTVAEAIGKAVKRQALIIGFSDTFAIIGAVLAIAAVRLAAPQDRRGGPPADKG